MIDRSLRTLLDTIVWTRWHEGDRPGRLHIQQTRWSKERLRRGDRDGQDIAWQTACLFPLCSFWISDTVKTACPVRGNWGPASVALFHWIVIWSGREGQATYAPPQMLNTPQQHVLQAWSMLLAYLAAACMQQVLHAVDRWCKRFYLVIARWGSKDFSPDRLELIRLQRGEDWWGKSLAIWQFGRGLVRQEFGRGIRQSGISPMIMLTNKICFRYRLQFFRMNAFRF